MKKNPFTVLFGKVPATLIGRDIQLAEIMDSFEGSDPEAEVCIITGLRGSGKTVAMNWLADEYRKEENWHVIKVGGGADIMGNLYAGLRDIIRGLDWYKPDKVSFSIPGLDLGFEKPDEIYPANAIGKMLAELTKRDQFVLVCVDETGPSKAMQELCTDFQIWISDHDNVRLLMTGLPAKVEDLQNAESMTFLYRAPKVTLQPLSFKRMAAQYEKQLGVSGKEALCMSQFTNGYAYAFQVLGYLCWKTGKPWQEVLDDFDEFLKSHVYDKIWHELSEKDQEILTAIASVESSKIADIRQETYTSNYFNFYKDRLMKKGILSCPVRGHVAFTLPRFREYVQDCTLNAWY